MTETPSRRKRILWLHTQPEHYHNALLDDLQTGKGYVVPGMDAEPAPQFDYIAAFAWKGPGLYAENVPKHAETVFLKVLPGWEDRRPGPRDRYHVDWRADLLPLRFDAAIVSGYAWRTQRELIRHCHEHRIPVAIWADSNLRADRGSSLKLRLKRAVKRSVIRRLTRDVDICMAANSLGRAYWRFYGVPREKIVLDPCYTDYRRIDAARVSSRREVLGRIGLGEESRLIYSSARLVEAKGLDLMIRAFQDARMAEKGWTYAIGGTGPLEGELKQLAGAAAGKSILFLGFQQPVDNLALMAHAEIMALPSRYEPHGIVVGEALAAGTPVLASDVVGAAYDLVEHGWNGMIFPTEDGEALRKILVRLMEEPNLLANLRGAARPSFEAWYRETSPMRVVPLTMARLFQRG